MTSVRVAAVAALLVATAVGCTSKNTGPAVTGVKVNGQLLANGKAVKMLQGEEIQVTFFESGKPAEGRIESMATADPETGAFTIVGPHGKGIPAGKYKVCLRSQVYGTNDDRLEEVFSMEATQLEVEVGPEEGQTFVIDLGKRTAKRQ
jgi:hypothetical protein